MTELLSCPFCGGNDLSVEVYDVQPEDYHGGYVTCANCDAQGANAISLNGWLSNPQDARNAAIAAWNTRPAIVTALRQAEAAPIDEADEEANRNAWSDFEDDYLTDGNDGWLDAKIVFACGAAFQAAWPKGRSKAFAAALACIPKPQAEAAPGAIESSAFSADEHKRFVIRDDVAPTVHSRRNEETRRWETPVSKREGDEA
jgi:Lar family restriction alleviation protein